MTPKKKKDDSYKTFVMDALAGLEDLRARSMFGGWGFYLGDRFFGIIWRGRLYFKTDDETRPEYLARGAEPFDPPRPHRQRPIMTYYTVPDDVLEDHDALKAWARRAARVPNRTAKK